MPISIAPVFASNPRLGVEEMLDSMVMRYIPAFRGVVLAHSNLHFLQNTAHIRRDCPFAVSHISFDATLWSPSIGTSLVGKINLCSPDHIALLVHRTFNASIPKCHIPSSQWEFEYGTEVDVEPPETEHPVESSGWWVDTFTGERLGGIDGYLQFTVTGLTVANEMLSLQGSI